MRSLSVLLHFLWAAVLTPLLSSASDFEHGIERLNRRQLEFDQKLSSLGIGPIVSPVGISARGEERSARALFKVHADFKALGVPAGKLLFGEIYTRLVVGPEGSPVLVQLAPGQGSLSGLRLMGTARQASGQDRLLIEFKRLLLRSGETVPLVATALDEQGALGLTSEVFSKKALAVTGSLASSFISGLAASQQTQTSNAFGFSQTELSGRNAVLQGVAQTAADQSKRLIDEATSEKPVLVVEARRPISILVQEEVRF